MSGRRSSDIGIRGSARASSQLAASKHGKSLPSQSKRKDKLSAKLLDPLPKDLDACVADYRSSFEASSLFGARCGRAKYDAIREKEGKELLPLLTKRDIDIDKIKVDALTLMAHRHCGKLWKLPDVEFYHLVVRSRVHRELAMHDRYMRDATAPYLLGRAWYLHCRIGEGAHFHYVVAVKKASKENFIAKCRELNHDGWARGYYFYYGNSQADDRVVVPEPIRHTKGDLLNVIRYGLILDERSETAEIFETDALGRAIGLKRRRHCKCLKSKVKGHRNAGVDPVVGVSASSTTSKEQDLPGSFRAKPSRASARPSNSTTGVGQQRPRRTTGMSEQAAQQVPREGSAREGCGGVLLNDRRRGRPPKRRLKPYQPMLKKRATGRVVVED